MKRTLFGILLIKSVGFCPTILVGESLPGSNPPYVEPITTAAGIDQPAYKNLNDFVILPTEEWNYHKSEDGTVPSGFEQALIWMMNRARVDPTSEGVWLAQTDTRDVDSAISFFGVDLDLMKSEFASRETVPPAAFDIRLWEAAKVHSDDLIARDAQDHNNQFQRINDAGYTYNGARGSVFSYAKGTIHGHAGWNIDWGYGGEGGMQAGRGHREATMGNFSSAGIAAVPENDSNTEVGPFVVTGNYCNAAFWLNDESHFNTFIVGTVWEDLNNNGIYEVGEGIGGVTVMPNSGQYFAITGDAGGYAIPVENGYYTVAFSGGTLSGEHLRTVRISDSDSELVNLHVKAHAHPDVLQSSSKDGLRQEWLSVLGTRYVLEQTRDFITWEGVEWIENEYGAMIQLERPWEPIDPENPLSLQEFLRLRVDQ